eukprot:TRINITY_DN18370_c0_g1_i1.p1 TRINITY_DN18370_c0_g1~~TRINITY_DN18370_c0_g1_i1.p1  ORF type:complete len:194 (-),score=39.29 TRINITY_DN18370_c0_g1_i1:30-554(-)
MCIRDRRKNIPNIKSRLNGLNESDSRSIRALWKDPDENHDHPSQFHGASSMPIIKDNEVFSFFLRKENKKVVKLQIEDKVPPVSFDIDSKGIYECFLSTSTINPDILSCDSRFSATPFLYEFFSIGSKWLYISFHARSDVEVSLKVKFRGSSIPSSVRVPVSYTHLTLPTIYSV